MTSPISAQLTISWDGVSLRIEAPGRNGARQKVEGILFDELPLDLKTNLIAQLEAEKDRRRNEIMALQRKNVDYVANDLRSVNLATKIWGSDWVESRTLNAQLSRARFNKSVHDKYFSETKDKKEKEILDLDI